MKYAATNPVSFTVSTVKVNKVTGIKDVKGPLKIPFDWKIYCTYYTVNPHSCGYCFLFLPPVQEKERS